MKPYFVGTMSCMKDEWGNMWWHANTDYY